MALLSLHKHGNTRRENRTPAWFFGLFMLISAIQALFQFAFWFGWVWIIMTGLWFCVIMKFQAGVGVACARARNVEITGWNKFMSERFGILVLLVLALIIFAFFYPLNMRIFMVVPAFIVFFQALVNQDNLSKCEVDGAKQIRNWEIAIILLIIGHFITVNYLFWGCYYCRHDSSFLAILNMTLRNLVTFVAMIIIQSDFFHTFNHMNYHAVMQNSNGYNNNPGYQPLPQQPNQYYQQPQQQF